MNARTLALDESRARRVVLVQAIETADTQGKLLSDTQRDAIDIQAAQAVQALPAPLDDQGMAAVLHQRAERVLQAVGATSAPLAALGQAMPWQGWLAWALPLVALALGVATDRIANPHRVDLLSLALLGIVGWNLLVYTLLAIVAVRGLGRPATPAAPAQAPSAWLALRRWAAALPLGRAGRLRQLQADVVGLFMQRWQALSSAISAQRLRGLLHLCAAAWGGGVALSLLLRGTVVAYRAGWESTFLDAPQVHALLSVLFVPVVALFSLEPFSVQEIASMRFDLAGGVAAGVAGEVASGGRRWALLYAGLLLVLVMLPRLLLAAASHWQALRLARRVSLDLADPYFQRLVDMLFPARVGLAVLAHNAQDEAVLMRVLHPGGEVDRSAPLLTTPMGDVLEQVPLAQAGVLLHVVGRMEDLVDVLNAPTLPACPALLLVRTPPGGTAARDALLAQCLLHQRNHDNVKAVLAFDDFARCWWQDTVWLQALGPCLPAAQGRGWARLAAGWQAGNEQRLQQAMQVLATELRDAAGQAQPAGGDTPSVKGVISGTQRDARAQAERAAMTTLLAQARQGAAHTLGGLLTLHGVDASQAASVEHRLEEKFALQPPLKASQAGAAGAAAGAAMGASVDLLTGGLTLGAAAALGALIGGGAALLGASWKNASGVTTVRLGDDMLLALTEAGLLRYLAAIHWGRGPVAASMGAFSAQWQEEVTAAVLASRQPLAALWRGVREGMEDSEGAEKAAEAVIVHASLARELEDIARQVLARLYPVSADAPEVDA